MKGTKLRNFVQAQNWGSKNWNSCHKLRPWGSLSYYVSRGYSSVFHTAAKWMKRFCVTLAICFPFPQHPSHLPNCARSLSIFWESGDGCWKPDHWIFTLKPTQKNSQKPEGSYRKSCFYLVTSINKGKLEGISIPRTSWKLLPLLLTLYKIFPVSASSHLCRLHRVEPHPCFWLLLKVYLFSIQNTRVIAAICTLK